MRGAGRGWRLAAGVVLIVLAFSASLVAQLAPISEARTKPKVKVSPRHDLIDLTGVGEYVSVSWSGFHRGSQIYMRECQRGATDVTSQCVSGSLDSQCGGGCPGIPYMGESDRQGSGSSIGQVGIGLLNTRQNLDPIDGRSFTCDFK